MSEATDELLSQIRDILASREQQYAKFIEDAAKRNGEVVNFWIARTRRWAVVQWCGIFIAVYAAVYTAMIHAR
jgi:hypothetical protein